MFASKYWRIRSAQVSDILQLMRVDRKVWAEITPEDSFLWTADQFQHQITVAPQYYKVAEHKATGQILGYVTAMPLELPRAELETTVTTWEAMCSGGNYDRVNSSGNAVFGVALAVLPEARNAGIGDDLVIELFCEAVYHGVEYGFLGGRLPGLAKWLAEHPDGTAEKYSVLRREDGKYLDPEMRLYEQDFKLVGLLPNYFPDPDSHDYGVLWEWKNPMPRWLPRNLAGVLFTTVIMAVIGLPQWFKRKK